MTQYANFIQAQLSATLLAGSESATVIVKAPGHLPASAHPDRQRLLLVDDQRRPTKFEIISYSRTQVTSGFVRLLDVERGLEGTTAAEWPAGTTVTNDLFAAMIAPLGESENDQVLTYQTGGGLALRQISVDELSDASVQWPLVLESRTSTPANPPTGKAILYYLDPNIGTEGIFARFDGGAPQLIQERT